MNPRYAVLLDGGFVTKILSMRKREFPVAGDIVAEVQRIASIPELNGHDLFRVYYYDAPPSNEQLTNPVDKSRINMTQCATYQQRLNFIRDLELTPNFAVRKGVTKTRGWKIKKSVLKDMGSRPPSQSATLKAQDLQPDIQQKGVDIRIGLDIALLALRHHVQVIVVVTGDSDFVPAFKFARREGVRLFFDHLGFSVKGNEELKVHADFVL